MEHVAGHLFPQPLVGRSDGSSVLLDEVIGQGFALILRQDAPSLPNLRELGDRVPFTIVTFGSTPGPGVVGDPSGALHKWFRREEVDFVLIRPDRYVYDAGRANQLEAVLQAFVAALPAGERAGVAA